jgi:RimK family alpha-L-glutamate ligase
MSGGYVCNRLAEEGGKLGLETRIAGVLDCRIDGGKVLCNGHEFSECDFAVIRHRKGAVRDALCSLASAAYNEVSLFDRYISKAAQLESLKDSGLRIPRYIVSPGRNAFDTAADRLGLPFVAKGLEGSRGDEVFLIRSGQDFGDLISRFGKEKEWLLEEFVGGTGGTDLRLFSIRGKPIACMKRTNPNDFRANYAQGATVTKEEITPELRGIAETVWERTHLDVAGIDLLPGRDGPVFCEVNVMPGMKGLESCTGVNAARACMELIKEDLAHGRA